MPVFVINGFLEAGKTQFITNTLQQDYFQADGTTVLILCEEGDTEYDKEILKKTRTKIVTVEDISEMDEDFYGRIERSMIRTACSSSGTECGRRISCSCRILGTLPADHDHRRSTFELY